MSIRLRLTLLYSTILALTLIAFSGVLYFALARVTFNELKTTLWNEAQRVKSTGRIVIDQKYGTQTYVQLLTLDGAVIDQQPSLGEQFPISDDQLRAVEDRATPFEEIVVGDERWLSYSEVIGVRGQRVVLQVARSLDDRDRTLAILRTGLVTGSSVATLLAFGTGWVLSGTALRPINRLTATARRIGSERNFGRRVEYHGPPDEVGRLATTFNTMLTELQASHAQVEHALDAQRRFVADASHELRTPLTTIRGNLGLLQRQPPIRDADRDAVLADMVDETERMSRLVNDLLVLARTDAGRSLRSEPVPLKPLIDELCRQAHALSTTHTIVCANDLDVAACGDEDALKQIVLILLDNALRYTPNDGTVTLATGTGGEHVTISVRDTGPGIAPEVLPHIFERFRRGDAARSSGGTGLGLAIAKALVDAQAGSITVASSANRGSVFTVTLPRA